MQYNQATLDKAKSWVKELQRQANQDIVIALVGNKLDIVTEDETERQVDYDDARAYAEEFNLLFFETSAKTGEFVNDVFAAIGKKEYKYIYTYITIEKKGMLNIFFLLFYFQLQKFLWNLLILVVTVVVKVGPAVLNLINLLPKLVDPALVKKE